MKAKRLVVMRRRRNTKQLVLLGILVVLAAIIIGIRYFEANDTTVALVNGQKITQEDVEKSYLRLAKTFENVTMGDALNQTIDETLLLQEADKLNITVNDSEIDKSISDYKQAKNKTDEDLKKEFEAGGIAFEDSREFLMKQQRISRLLNETIFSKIEVTDDDVALYSEAFKQASGETLPDDQIRKIIFNERARKVLSIYLIQLHAQADIKVLS